MQYRDDGFLPDAMVNYLARLGWSHGDDEVFSREQLVEWFDLAHVNRSPARWDPEKLKWLNGEYLKRLSDEELVKRIRDEKPELYRSLADVMDPVAMSAAWRAKVQTLSDHEYWLATMMQPSRLTDPAAMSQLEQGRDVLQALAPKLRSLEPWAAANVSATLKALVAERSLKMPQVMMPFRLALTGLAQTPSIDAIAAALKREVVLQRIERAVSD
jgi:glutamyl-tRNA synthetase